MRKFILLTLAVMTISVSYAQEINGIWGGILHAGNQKLEIVFHFNQSADGNSTATMDVPAQSALDIPLTIKLLTVDFVSVEAAAIQMGYTGKLNNGTITGTFKQYGISFPMELTPKADGTPARPQEPRETADYKTEEVSFTNPEAGISLAGTLTYPVNYTPGEKVPVVLMITGSGAQNRDEEVFGHRPFLVMADYLARQGIASLRYDDRGVGASGGTQTGCTSADLAQDAASGLQWLKAIGKFSKTGILGHSEGGMIAFMLGAEGKADFLVSMAGPGIKGDTLLAEQQNAILRLKGIPARTSVNTLRETMATQPGNVWLEYFMDYDPQCDLQRITVPLMAINGSLDLQVLPGSNLSAIRNHLANRNPKNLIREYPGLNHLFQHCEPATAMDYYEIEETCSPEVLQDIADWIQGL